MTVPEAGWVLVYSPEPDEFDWSDYHDGGALLGAELEKDGRRFPVMFFDPTRLGQAAAMGIESDQPFYLENAIVVPEITRQVVEAAVEKLGRERFFDWMLG